MRRVNFVVNVMANTRKLIILMVREGNKCDLDMKNRHDDKVDHHTHLSQFMLVPEPLLLFCWCGWSGFWKKGTGVRVGPRW